MRPVIAIVCLCLSGLLGCHELTGSQPLPAGTPNPDSYDTPAGALEMRTAALYEIEQVLPEYLVSTGLLTDELESNAMGASPGFLLSDGGNLVQTAGDVDERVLPEQYNTFSLQGGPITDAVYNEMQVARGSITQALGALTTYDTGTAQQGNALVMRGELYSLEGYTELLLADLFCSGIPLSTLDFQRDFTYHASSTRAQVDSDAIFKVDSALLLVKDSTRIENLALVVKGRALLELGLYSQAAQAVATVPDSFRYQLAVPWITSNVAYPFGFSTLSGSATMSNSEGINGLPYLADPRTAPDTLTPPGTYGSNQIFQAEIFPRKYSDALSGGGFSAFSVADGIEARLIEAEAALQGGAPAQMVAILNHLRETVTVPGQTGGLPDLTDPGSDTAEVSLLFRERAYWLYLTGHRQADLRRLIRQYGRLQNRVYPTGHYDAPGVGISGGLYGTDVTAPIPAAEFTNPLFHGCLDRNA